MKSDMDMKKDIVSLVAANFGTPTAQAFSSIYLSKPLSELSNEAYAILSDLIGRERAKTSIRSIYRENNMEEPEYV
jgi:hypothetical protein